MKVLLVILFLFSCDFYKGKCENNAINPPGCNKCYPGRMYLDGQCAMQIAPECPAGKIYIDGQCERHGTPAENFVDETGEP